MGLSPMEAISRATYPRVNGGPAAAIEDHQFHESQSVMISCGCVGVDAPRGKVALLRKKTTGPAAASRSLPRGRKNMYEDLLTAALRESSEETGIVYRAMPLRIPTRATPPKNPPSADDEDEASSEPVNPEVTDTLLNCEPSSVVMYPYEGNQVVKIIFWFAASVDSTEVPVAGTKEAWEEDYVLEWVNVSDAPGLLDYQGDARAVEKVIQDMRGSGYAI